VVASVQDVSAHFARNSFGDQLIVSRVLLQLEENLKGSSAEPMLSVDVEGGTIGDLTLHVSDLPALRPGERAVFFLERTGDGHLVPHLRGLGILKLTDQNSVRGSTLTLASVRQMVRAVRP
jgi:hypothetical protein